MERRASPGRRVARGTAGVAGELEQRSLHRLTGPPREPLRTVCLLANNDEVRAGPTLDPGCFAHSQGAQARGTPASVVFRRRLAYDQPPSNPQEAGRTLSGSSRTTHSSGHHQIQPASQRRTGHVLGATLEYPHPPHQSEAGYRLREKDGAAAATVKKQPPTGGARESQGEARNAGPASEVEGTAARVSYDVGKPECMVHMGFHRARPQEAFEAGGSQYVEKHRTLALLELHPPGRHLAPSPRPNSRPRRGE